MNPLSWISRHFGITTGQMVAFFRFSRSLVVKAASGERRLPRSMERFFQDPLFAPYDIEAELPEPVWEDPDPASSQKEQDMRLLELKGKIEKQHQTLVNFEKRHRQLRALLHHTRHLPDAATGNEPLARQWWILKRGEALFELENYTRHHHRRLQIKLAQLETEKRMWEEG